MFKRKEKLIQAGIDRIETEAQQLMFFPQTNIADEWNDAKRVLLNDVIVYLEGVYAKSQGLGCVPCLISIALLILSGKLDKISFDAEPWLEAALAQNPRDNFLNNRIAFWRKKRETKLMVLQRSSRVNTLSFSAWAPEGRSVYSKKSAFEDPDGNPRLSAAQQKRFTEWRRMPKLAARACVLVNAKRSLIDADLSQSDCVANCSLVSSLLIMAQHENMHSGFATQMLFPRDGHNYPMFSASGRYDVKLFWNGMERKVTVDDFFPVDAHGRLLCVSSLSNPNEFWASLIEKAYLKLVAGGYDLWTGSNSGIDIYALTGWPPETLSFNPSSFEDKRKTSRMYRDELWRKLINAMKIKDNLITACTRSDLNEAATGLPRSHAFAILAASETDCRSKRRLLLRNPWGRNAEGFWTNLDDMPNYFTSAYINWNTALFSNISHHSCQIPIGESLELKGFHGTVQFQITVPPETKLVWLLLSRHIHSVVELESVDDALACHAFEGSGRVLTQHGSRLISKGSYCTGPHSLCRVENFGSTGSFVVVLSAYRPTRPVDCTLSVFSTSGEISIQRLPEILGSVQICRGPNSPADQPRIWTVKLPRISGVLAKIKLHMRVSIYPEDPSLGACDFDVILIDIKFGTQVALATSVKQPSKAKIRSVEFVVPAGCIDRTSVRLLIVERGCLAPKGVSTSTNEHSHIVEIDCEIAGVELICPSNQESDQQKALRQLLQTLRPLSSAFSQLTYSGSSASISI